VALRRCQFHRLTLTILEANQLDPVKNMFRHDLGLLQVTLEYGSRAKRPQKLFLQVWSLGDNRSPFSKTVWKLTVWGKFRPYIISGVSASSVQRACELGLTKLISVVHNLEPFGLTAED